MAKKGMQVQFVARENGPERLVTEAEVLFDDGPLAGTKLVGFSLWKSPDGEIYVTFPSRAFGTGTERRFFDFLRSVEGTSADARRVKAWILDSYGTRAAAEYPPTDSAARGISRAPSKAVQEALG